MNSRLSLLVMLFVMTAMVGAGRGQSTGLAPTFIFSTKFETSEGYDPDLTLSGQNGWVSEGSGGNGLVADFLEGLGQHAFIGFVPPTDSQTTNVVVWKPVNYAPSANKQPVIKFSVMMSIMDSTSTNRHYDDFRWSVYNTNGVRLFTLDFDNKDLFVSYALDDGQGFVSTGTSFTNSALYELVMTMNFARNLWSASVNDMVVVNSKPISTQGSASNLGDVDAVWAIRTPGSPGDNFMLFDNYEITIEPLDSIPPRLESTARLSNGQFLLRLYGESSANYAIEASADLRSWTSIKTNSAPDGIVDFLDTSAPNFALRFYRARLVR